MALKLLGFSHLLYISAGPSAYPLCKSWLVLTLASRRHQLTGRRAVGPREQSRGSAPFNTYCGEFFIEGSSLPAQRYDTLAF